MVSVFTGGFRASEIGVLLGAKGLRWAGDGAYRELGLDVGPNHTKFWHREVPEWLRRVLDENNPCPARDHRPVRPRGLP